MTSEEIIEKIKSDQEGNINSSDVNLGDAVIFIAPEKIHDVMEYLKDDPRVKF